MNVRDNIHSIFSLHFVRFLAKALVKVFWWKRKLIFVNKLAFHRANSCCKIRTVHDAPGCNFILFVGRIITVSKYGGGIRLGAVSISYR